MASKRKSLAIKTAADFSSRTEMGTIEIAQGGILVGVEVTVIDYVLTTAQTVGGLVELTNDALDWTPFEFYTNSIVAVTSTSTGGANMKPFLMRCHKQIPSESTTTIFYTAADAGDQSLGVTLIWETTMSYRGVQTYAKKSKGTEITQITAALVHNSVQIPAGKGAPKADDLTMNVKRLMWVVHGTLETIVQSGGLVQLHNDSSHWEPLEYWTSGASCIGAGAVEVDVEVKQVNLNAKSRSKVTLDFTPYDNQSQAINLVAVWEGR